jgi:hypothetical protein
MIAIYSAASEHPSKTTLLKLPQPRSPVEVTENPNNQNSMETSIDRKILNRVDSPSTPSPLSSSSSIEEIKIIGPTKGKSALPQKSILRPKRSPKKNRKITINTKNNTQAKTFSPKQYKRKGTRKTKTPYEVFEYQGKYHVFDKIQNRVIHTTESEEDAHNTVDSFIKN